MPRALLAREDAPSSARPGPPPKGSGSSASRRRDITEEQRQQYAQRVLDAALEMRTLLDAADPR